jgi:hypothetical protein
MKELFLLDANAFIEAKNQYYRLDTFPVFWSWLDSSLTSGPLASIKRIRDELLKGKDELAEWIDARKSFPYFLPVNDEPTQSRFAEISTWVMGQPYTPRAQFDFLAGGDPWLIAKALTTRGTVVTLETYEPKRLNKVKIPNVCHHFNVSYINTFDLLQQLGIRFS